MLAHLAADVGEDLVSVGQLDPEHGIRKGLHDGALKFDHAFFLRHVLHNLLFGLLPFVAPLHGVERVAREPPSDDGGPRAVVRGDSSRARCEPLVESGSCAIGQPRGTTKHDPRWADTPV